MHFYTTSSCAIIIGRCPFQVVLMAFKVELEKTLQVLIIAQCIHQAICCGVVEPAKLVLFYTLDPPCQNVVHETLGDMQDLNNSCTSLAIFSSVENAMVCLCFMGSQLSRLVIVLRNRPRPDLYNNSYKMAIIIGILCHLAGMVHLAVLTLLGGQNLQFSLACNLKQQDSSPIDVLFNFSSFIFYNIVSAVTCLWLVCWLITRETYDKAYLRAAAFGIAHLSVVSLVIGGVQMGKIIAEYLGTSITQREKVYILRWCGCMGVATGARVRVR